MLKPPLEEKLQRQARNSTFAWMAESSAFTLGAHIDFSLEIGKGRGALRLGRAIWARSLRR